MAFPSVFDVEFGSSSSTTSHSISFPNHSEGDLIVVLFAVGDENNESTPTMVSADQDGWRRRSGWARVPSTGDDIQCTLHIFYKVAQSSSESLTLTSDNSRSSAHMTYAIQNGTEIEVYWTEGRDTSSPDPAELDTGVSREYLWVAGIALDSSFSTATAPTGYDSDGGGIGTTVSVRGAHRTPGTPHSSEDPDTFGLSSNTNYIAATIGVWNDLGHVSYTEDWLLGLSDWSLNDPTGDINGQHSQINDAADGDGLISGATSTNIFAGSAEDQVVSQGYWEWTGTFEDLGVPPGETVVGYSGISIHTRWDSYLNMETAFVGDNSGSYAITIDDGTTRGLLSNLSDPGSTTAEYVEDSTNPAISGLSLASDTNITLRIYVYFESFDTASNRFADVIIDNFRISIDLDVSTTIEADVTDVAIGTPAFTTATQLQTDTADIVIDTPEIKQNVSIIADTGEVAIGAPIIQQNVSTNLDVTDIAINTLSLTPTVVYSGDVVDVVVNTREIQVATSESLDVVDVAVEALEIKQNVSIIADTSEVSIETPAISQQVSTILDVSDIAVDLPGLLTKNTFNAVTGDISIETPAISQKISIIVDVGDVAIETLSHFIGTSINISVTDVAIEVLNINVIEKFVVGVANIAIDTGDIRQNVSIVLNTVDIGVETLGIKQNVSVVLDTDDIAIDTSKIQQNVSVIVDLTNIAIETPAISQQVSTILDLSDIAVQKPDIIILSPAMPDVTNIAVEPHNISIQVFQQLVIADVAIEPPTIMINVDVVIDATDITIEKPGTVFGNGISLDVVDLSIELFDIEAKISKHLVSVEYVGYCFVEDDVNTYKWTAMSNKQPLHVAKRHDITVEDEDE